MAAVLIILVLGIITAVALNVARLRRYRCVFRRHDTVPLKRIGKRAFVVECMHCGRLYLKTQEYGPYCYTRYRGQFDDFEDYADERAEAEPTFVEDEDANV